MSRRGLSRRAVRLFMTLTLSAGALSVNGCNPAVREVLIAGLQTTVNALVNTLVQSFFTALQNNVGGSGQTTI